MKKILGMALALCFTLNVNIVQAIELNTTNQHTSITLDKKQTNTIKKHLIKWRKASNEVQQAVKQGLVNLCLEKDLKTVSKTELMALNLLPPNKAYIATIASKYNIAYNRKAKGNDIFYGANGEPIYPENDGFIGKPSKETLMPDKYLLDRFGAPRGRFFAFYGADFGSRALNKYDIEDFKAGRKEYHIYKIVKPIPDVLLGTAAPWFGEKGGCTQGMVQNSMSKYLKNGELVEVFDKNEANRIAQAFGSK